MKKVLLLTLCLSLCAGAAFADHIGLYADAAGTGCYLSTVGAPPGPTSPVYVVHKFNSAGSTGSQFKVVDTSGLFAVSSAVSAPFLLIGTLAGGASIAYTSCLAGDIVVATLQYWNFGTPLTDCNRSLEIVADPTAVPAPLIGVVDCGFVTKVATGGKFYFGLPNCACNEPNATQSSTWGNVKALYR